ncbi:MAG TPA: BamA/TamA family outer membrane protein [Anaeromyxobacteraceae bacterium]|nr:BamA/TamA family outer membrane protein [Anaeromyxobacteraceae bacterium]
MPRVILLPAYLVAEYVVRTPVGAVATAAEKGSWPNTVFQFFAFGPDNRGGIFPVFFLDFGFRPSIGLHFFWEDAFAAGNKVTADAAWGGSNWITLAVGDRYRFTKDSSLAVEARWNRRPDSIYFGIGSETPDTFRSRYGTDVVGGTVTYRQIVHRALRLEAGAALVRTIFRDYSCCSDPTLAQRVAAGELPAPPGFEENTTAAGLGFRAVLDTRSPGPTDRSGIRVGLEVGPAVDVTRGFDRSWIKYGAGVEGSWDVTGKGRVLSLGVLALFADPLGSQPVPFTELVTVGGAEPFTGFLRGRLRDRSALGAQLSWRWPVFAYLDGVAAVGFGNVFEQHLSNFRWDLLRLSAELGVRTAAALGASNFQFVIGVGTEPFSQGLRLTSFSLAFGVTYAL